MRTLVAAAYPPELAGLTQLVADAMARGEIVARAVGVGLVEAAAGAERALAETRPDRVILVGTAGYFAGSGLAIGGVVVARRAALVVREPEYVPAIMPTQVSADEALAGAFAATLGAPLVQVASPLGITCRDDEAARLGREGSEVEQLECFAVLAAAARAGVPATAVLAISNRVGESGAAEWRAHREAAEAAALRAVARVLQ
jgi:nucleoside phosphorylase